MPQANLTEYLGWYAGPPLCYATGQRLFDLLVLRGRLRPWSVMEGFWELDTIEEVEWPELCEAIALPRW
ncbi:hypothetical protein [Cyanobium sp. LEGE 06113]|uniref:hypothetical protein n=1 Tax=Cyanobium sp. LEGE 06113 TaxID=1297573 RepID=UPI0018814E79|nr:hypothetical protein [Cyanobium sp. LEGE 06113]MBE9155181.1 hypothetical protein [Cyanobium sp. LEGE 06113]